MEHKKEVMTISNNINFRLILTIDIKQDGENILLYCEKMKLSNETEGTTLINAKKEFAFKIIEILNFAISKGILFSYLNSLGFKLQPIQKIIKDKTEEIKTFEENKIIAKKNIYNVDLDSMIINPDINFSMGNVIWN